MTDGIGIPQTMTSGALVESLIAAHRKIKCAKIPVQFKMSRETRDRMAQQLGGIPGVPSADVPRSEILTIWIELHLLMPLGLVLVEFSDGSAEFIQLEGLCP